MQKQRTKVATFYARLFSSGFFIVDEKEPYFQEKVLQIIWNEQILTQNLSTELAQQLEVIHPGFWNVESGPDFHEAVIAINGKIIKGDIEIHLNAEDWNKHHHQFNQDYNSVILHCVWRNSGCYKEFPEGIPLCDLSRFLAVPIKKILSQINLNTYSYAKKIPPSRQATWISQLENNRLSELLQSYGITRNLRKAHTYTQDIEKYGLNSAAYRALFDIMGYKNNRKPFQKLASLISLEELSSYSEREALAILFGTATLLPDPTQVKIKPEYMTWVHEMWSIWWSKRKDYKPLQWNKHRFRPYNSPERRIIAGYCVIVKNSYRLGSVIIKILSTCGSPDDCIKSLQQIFEIKPERHILQFLTFSKSLSKPIALLGESRINDIIVNFAIPFFFANCLINGEPEHCLKGKKVLLKIPILQDNRTLKEAVHYFLTPPSRSKEVIINACSQQGLLHLYKATLANTGQKP